MRCPTADEELRERLGRECDAKGPASLHERLKKLDPESAAKIHPNDRVRVIRALEIISLAGEALSSIQQEHDFGDNKFLSLQQDQQEEYLDD